MSTITDRYDRNARLYARHWAPVLAPTVRRLLDVASPWLPPDGAGATILDVGAGTGSLTLAAARRWPAADIVALDPSTGMLAVAGTTFGGLVSRPQRLTGAADAVPLPDGSVDVALSSFVLQLVPDRPAALREIRRVLRPGGRLAYVTWLDEARPFAPDDVFDEAVLDLDVDEPDEPDEDRTGDVPSPSAAAAELRRAGFRAAGGRRDTLEHRWSPAGYLDYKLAYDEVALVSSLDRSGRARLRALARERLDGLAADDFVWRAGVVVAWGQRPR